CSKSCFSSSALFHRSVIWFSHSTAVSNADNWCHSVIGNFKVSVGLYIISHPHATRETISSIKPLLMSQRIITDVEKGHKKIMNAWPLLLCPGFIAIFRPRAGRKNERVYRVHDRFRALPRCLVALLRER